MSSDDIPSLSERKTLTVRSGYTPKEHPVHIEEHVINVPLSSSSSRRDAQADLIRTTVRTGDALTHQMLGRRKGPKRAGADPFQKRGLQNAPKRSLDKKKNKTVKHKRSANEPRVPKMEINPLGAYALGAYPSQYIQPAAAWTPTESYAGLSIPQVMPMMNIEPEVRDKPAKTEKKKKIRSRKSEDSLKKNQRKKSVSAAPEKKSSKKAAKSEKLEKALLSPLDWSSAEPELPSDEIRNEFDAWVASIDSNEVFTKTLKGECLIVENDISLAPIFEPGWHDAIEPPTQKRASAKALKATTSADSGDSSCVQSAIDSNEKTEGGQRSAKAKKTRRTGYHLTAARVRGKGRKRDQDDQILSSNASADAGMMNSGEGVKESSEAIGDSGNVSKRRRRTKYGLLRGNKGNNKKSGAAEAPSSNE